MTTGQQAWQTETMGSASSPVTSCLGDCHLWGPSFPSVKRGYICSREDYLLNTYSVPGIQSSQCWSYTSEMEQTSPIGAAILVGGRVRGEG